MATTPSPNPTMSASYGSAKDLPSYQELSQLILGGKIITFFVARNRREEFFEIERELDRLIRVVDDFYARLGPRNWIFHDMMNVSKIEKILADTSDPATMEARLIDLYRDEESTKYWVTRLRAHEGLRARFKQIERARDHYRTRQFDSCVLQLIAIMDGFVNDFEPHLRRGLTSREPEEMMAWDSVVGHHLGLTNVMRTFRKKIKKRVDDEVFDVYRNGIVHGSVVNFDNVIVATKAWNLLFAVADWATARENAVRPPEPKPTVKHVWAALQRNIAFRRYQEKFVPSRMTPVDRGFDGDELVLRAEAFLDAWQHKRWGPVAQFRPPQLLKPLSVGEAARSAKETFGRYEISNWKIVAVGRDQPSAVEIAVHAVVNGVAEHLRFRMILWTPDGDVGVPSNAKAEWRLAVWAPATFLAGTK